MSIWNYNIAISELNNFSQNTMLSHLDIEFTEMGEDFLSARMPVDHRTHQPDGVLHGGASVALAETLGSVAANLCVDRNFRICVGLSINANHVKSVRDGYVIGTAKPIHLGSSTHIWEIRITDPKGSLICISRLTMAILQKNNKNDRNLNTK